MKKYIFLFCLLFANTLGLIAQNCDYQINLKTQEEIDNFSTNHPCTTFSEGIFIMEDTSGAITNLNGLSQITQVGDFLTIRDNDSLTNLTGLENLQETDYLSIKNNGSLEDLSGLENLQISEGLTIESNTSLTNINSLSNLTSLAGGLSIKSCPILENLSGLEALVELGSLTITECEAIVNLEGIGELSKLSILFLDDNESILSLEGLEGIDTIANLYLFEMPNLTSLIALDGVVISGGMTLRELNSLVNLQGLENIGSKISGNLIFSNIPSLSSISSLSNITETGGGVVVGNCDMLSNLHGLHNIEKIGLAFGLSIGGNESLENISALANLDSIMGVFYIDYNPLLTSLDGLENLVHVGRGFTISNNESLNDLTALSGPLNIRNSFRIQGNSSLQSLSGLDSIKHFHATNDTLPLHYFTIENNPQLTDISAISNLEITKAAYVKILGNDSLSLCGQGNICSFLLEGGEHLIGNNAPGCNTAAEVIESCFEGIDYSSAAGNLAGDLNENCVTDIGDPIIRNWLITFDHADYSWTTRTDEEGNYWLPIVGGEWTLNAVSSSPYWTPCFSDTIVYSTALGDTIFTDFTMEPQGDCSYFDWDVSLPNFRICDTTKFTIHYCNLKKHLKQT